jgi:hypothetical protein
VPVICLDAENTRDEKSSNSTNGKSGASVAAEILKISPVMNSMKLSYLNATIVPIPFNEFFPTTRERLPQAS